MTGKDFINTRHEPFYQAQLRNEAAKSRAYFNQVPYPSFGFRDWKTEELGPIPLCLPFPRHIIEKSARWLFGKPIAFLVNSGEESKDIACAKRLEQIWAKARMHTRIKSASEVGAQTGGYYLKFSYCPEMAEPVCIDIFDAAQQVMVYTDPMDINTVLMVRIQYPFYNAVEGVWYMWREEWTSQEHITYVPIRINEDPSTRLDVGSALIQFSAYILPALRTWDIKDRKRNAFGVIPGQLVKNLDIGAEHGWGDIWSLYPLIDRINLTADLANKSNQLVAFPKDIRVNLTTPPDDDGAPLAPQDAEYLVPVDPELPFDVKQFEGAAQARSHVKTYMDDLVTVLYNTVGSVFLSPASMTGHGALSQQVLKLIYQPLIELTEDKRQSQGECGISPFLQTLCQALANLGVQDDAAMPDADVKILWPDFFDPTEEELKAKAERVILEVQAGLVQKDAAMKTFAAEKGEGQQGESGEIEEPEDEKEDDLAAE